MLMSELFWTTRREWVATLSELGLHPMQAMALRHLDAEEGLPMSSLADVLRCDNSNVTGLADRLEAAGLIERRPAPHDRRIKTLVLTGKGVETRRLVEAKWAQPPPPLARLSKAEARALRDVLRRALSDPR